MEVRNTATGEGVAVEWDIAMLPHLWYWHEARESGGRWRHAGEQLGLEPVSVPHSLGLARAVAEGQAHIVEPGSELHQPDRRARLLDGGCARVRKSMACNRLYFVSRGVAYVLRRKRKNTDDDWSGRSSSTTRPTCTDRSSAGASFSAPAASTAPRP